MLKNSKERIFIMPKCVQCYDFFHPDYMVEVDVKDNAYKCVFCHLDKKEITIATDDGKKEEKLTKKECVQKYKAFLNRLYRSEKIQNILTKDGSE